MGKGPIKMVGKFTGLHSEGQIPSGQPYPLPETIAGSRGPVVVRLSPISGGGLEKAGLSSRYDDSRMNMWAEGLLTFCSGKSRG
jgi:hypothetical protein